MHVCRIDLKILSSLLWIKNC
uniref:Uncharacterized protein n=1 Tax=Rhizophora mucronata TaxID=61149 RepID=A0A2P2IN47_RHIMU